MINLYFQNGSPTVDLVIDVYKGQTAVKEDFSRAQVFLWLCRDDERILLSCEADKDGQITASFSDSDFWIKPAVYSIKVMWYKNCNREILHKVDRMNNLEHRVVGQAERLGVPCMAEFRNAFVVTNFVEDATPLNSDRVTIHMETRVATYGYDGLDAYELAVLRGKTTLTENEWIDRLMGLELDPEAGTITFGGRTFKLTEINIPVVLKTEYGVPEVTLTYSKVGASGGSVSPNLSYKQKKTETYSNGNVVETYITTGGEIVYTGDCNADGIVTAEASTVTGEHKVGEVTVTVTMNGKAGTCKSYVFQSPYTAPQPEYHAYYGFGNAVPDTIDETSVNYYPLPTDEPVKVTTQFSDKAKVHWVAYKRTAGVNLQKALDFEDDDITANVGTVVKGTWVIHYISMSIYISNTTKFYLV